MSRFTFAVNVDVDGTRYQANKIQDSLIEAVAEWGVEQDEVIGKARGMTLQVTTVKQVKEAQS